MSREQQIHHLLSKVLRDEMSEAEFLKTVRKQVLNMTQERYAQLTDVSRLSVMEFEADRGKPSRELLDKLLSPIGLKLVPVPKKLDKRLQFFLNVGSTPVDIEDVSNINAKDYVQNDYKLGMTSIRRSERFDFKSRRGRTKS